MTLIFHFWKWNDFMADLVTHRQCSQDKTPREPCDSECAKITRHVSSSPCPAGHQPKSLRDQGGMPGTVPGPHTGQGPLRGDPAVWGNTWQYWLWLSYLKIFRSKCISPQITSHLPPNPEVPKTECCLGPARQIQCTWHQVAKVLELQLQHQSFQWIFSVDFL